MQREESTDRLFWQRIGWLLLELCRCSSCIVSSCCRTNSTPAKRIENDHQQGKVYIRKKNDTTPKNSFYILFHVAINVVMSGTHHRLLCHPRRVSTPSLLRYLKVLLQPKLSAMILCCSNKNATTLSLL